MLKKLTPSAHSDIVGGSTAKQVINCPGSIKLCQQVPKQKPSDDARTGTMLHEAIAAVVADNLDPAAMIGFTHDGIELTQSLYAEKLLPAIEMFDDLLDEIENEYKVSATVQVESNVSFGSYLPDVFGSADIIIRCGPKAIMLDWKFGNGVAVSAEANEQLMFYACAAMRTEETKSAFEDAEDIELIIIQPPEIKRGVVTFADLARFERKLKAAVKRGLGTEPEFNAGDHCRWCKGKPLCPLMNGAADRALQIQLKEVNVQDLGKACEQSYLLEQWIADLRQLVQTALESGVEVPGWKLVAKRGIRKWVKSDDDVVTQLIEIGCTEDDIYTEPEVKSPVQMEKALKALKLNLPEDLVASVSSGSTLAPISDPRPAVNTHVQLAGALKKLKNI